MPTLHAESATERWLPVDGWPGYEISDHGRLRSYRGSGWKPGRDRKVPIIIGGYPSKRYGRVVCLQVCLYRTNPDGTREKWRNGIHILVLTAFVGPCPEGMEGCHKNSDPTDNRLSNIRWGTPASNKLDLMMREDSQFKLSNEDVRAIWPRLLAGEMDTAIAKDYGMSAATITLIKLGDTWTHVTKHLPGFPIVTDARAAAKRQPVRIPKELCESPVEIWRPIPGYPDYRASTFGNVESHWEILGRGRARGFVYREDWIPANIRIDRGRPKFLIRVDDVRRKEMHTYTAVLLAFAGPRPPGMICCHEDDDPLHNHARNIRWDSHRANRRDAIRNAPPKAEKLLAEAYPDQFPQPPG